MDDLVDTSPDYSFNDITFMYDGRDDEIEMLRAEIARLKAEIDLLQAEVCAYFSYHRVVFLLFDHRKTFTVTHKTMCAHSCRSYPTLLANSYLSTAMEQDFLRKHVSSCVTSYIFSTCTFFR